MTKIARLSQTGLMEALTVGQVAETYGVTVRTLHHYDEVGLLHPSERTGAGYRLYTAGDPGAAQHDRRLPTVGLLPRGDR
uniref:MerR family DNA-binding transcriptional regulator n=1 Tax=Janibacter limosus TaxID=53458 RepID=A0AC61U4J8_9MICO|nr:MerR family DNA-binding transcriptional regulator [Janibacter limosus]